MSLPLLGYRPVAHSHSKTIAIPSSCGSSSNFTFAKPSDMSLRSIKWFSILQNTSDRGSAAIVFVTLSVLGRYVELCRSGCWSSCVASGRSVRALAQRMTIDFRGAVIVRD